MVMLVILTGLFIWRTSTFLEGAVKETSTFATPLCQLSEPCTVKTDFGDFILTVKEGKIVPDEPYHLTLHGPVKDWMVSSAQVVGTKNYTGRIPVTLVRDDDQSNAIIYQATSMIGACSEDNVQLQLQIVVLVNGKELPIKYNFSVDA